MKITVKDLWKSYGEESVFQGFSTEISPGEITVLMGRSGCGKTTFTRILLGLEKADRGTVSGLPEKKSMPPYCPFVPSCRFQYQGGSW